MATLQKVVLGTPPSAVDGDTVRVANTKANANVDVLNTQAALTSATGITAAQALTAAHIGKRINIALAAAGVINLPAASTCATDNVLLLRNIGTTVVTLAITVGSGDTIALSKLNPGEAALMDTDGVHAWTVLMRGRTNSDNEVVNGNCAVNGNETVGGTLAVTGAITATGGFSARPAFNGATPWDTNNLPAVVRTECYLFLSGSNLILGRKLGSALTVNGAHQVIPAAGLSLSPAGNAANSLYYIYAAMVSGSLALEYSTTGYTLDPATGLPTKTGDTSRTLVGIALSGPSAGTWLGDVVGQIGVLSYFNRRSKVAFAQNSNGTTSSLNTPYIGITFLNWADETINFRGNGTGTMNASGSYIAGWQIDGVNASAGHAVGLPTVGYAGVCAPEYMNFYPEGKHVATMYAGPNNGTLTATLTGYVITRG
ncbi:hypothetical protein [Paraburkholderia caledonica]|uniref:hypothetical protein n=1 Tax=Paraburkholderia caledonica TaxID=134536 RepID=UPI0038B8AAF9